MNSMIAAAIQITATDNKKENWEKVARFVGEAVSKKANFIVLPEHWNWLGKSSDKKSVAERLEGPSIQFVQELAKKYSCWIVAGSIAETNGDKPPFNTTVFIHPDGKLGKVYRKIHLFDAQVAEGHKESDFTSAGQDVVVEDLGWANVGLSICYDVRFPELYRQLATKGADVFAIPSNFTIFTGAPHWEVLVRARAIENQCFVIAADQTGLTGAGWEAHGHSMIVDPWGEILAQAGKQEGVIVVTLDFRRLSEIRNKMPVHSHRKL
ncbi:MAG: hypothetical protein A2W61_04235 [Deltaproteobacteria bacterium RIFCSPLOWO2_01_44_7]|nr:MAG: hypothetical protein A2712_03370 [Deltaproteobacteria bacterium RIFCSPHIGHO2_01_FULL_43_49]OGQ16234.1 MAG: hypothetical protein A3D22_01340 [Deltaproteobacteria bacterium RIFCSPHIGHO2_02_FULL_44_53]OGQ29194.1 MAG: hypothetical protein A3D98_05125 [Deltaproteobacteria bacterium RIFCSPHIGHO2_12_FULL_44_21]OGQ32751.1 MAG: hypothetical protein A2979_09270 [Deltaproteobacteria bacterium RIFCSPLOWO2_01_FULL_45_74]OGQ41853.1 MAG: hypothetical protein A3I70_09055 [Deltaproteobacteria bacterium 